jgi:hypothetical protein
MEVSEPMSDEENKNGAPPPSVPPNVRPIVPGMPVGAPRLDPISELFQSMGMSFEHMTTERDSPKGRAWDLVCACARRAPVDEETVRLSLRLSLFFETEWKKQEAQREAARFVDAAEKS